jgi:hypothetical protein
MNLKDKNLRKTKWYIHKKDIILKGESEKHFYIECKHIMKKKESTL